MPERTGYTDIVKQSRLLTELQHNLSPFVLSSTESRQISSLLRHSCVRIPNVDGIIYVRFSEIDELGKLRMWHNEARCQLRICDENIDNAIVIRTRVRR